MNKPNNLKGLFTLVLLISLFSLAIVNAASIEVRELPQETIDALKCLSSEECIDCVDCEDCDNCEEALEIMAIECPNCSGLLSSRHVGTGSWDVISTTLCRQHARCSIIEERRFHYFEERCGSLCGYFRSYSSPEYRYTHKNF